MAECILSAFPLSYDMISRTPFNMTILSSNYGQGSIQIPDGYSNFSLTIPQVQIHLIITDDDNESRNWGVQWIVTEGSNEYRSPYTYVIYEECDKYFTLPKYIAKGPITSNKISISLNTWMSTGWKIIHEYDPIIIDGYFQY